MEHVPHIALAEASAPQDLSLRQRFLNSPAARRVTAAVAALGLMSGAGEMALNTEPVAADTSVPVPVLDPTLKQWCVNEATTKPTILNSPIMRNAGVRPFTPHHMWHTQDIYGKYEMSDMSQCEPDIVRVLHGQIQMQKFGNRKVWVNDFSNDNPEYNGDQGDLTGPDIGPTHAWPDYLFNECENGKWLKVRNVLTADAIDENTNEVLAEKRYTIPVQVKGSCKLAAYSTKATKGLKSQWGQ